MAARGTTKKVKKRKIKIKKKTRPVRKIVRLKMKKRK